MCKLKLNNPFGYQSASSDVDFNYYKPAE